jgi:hypothetical protein
MLKTTFALRRRTLLTITTAVICRHSVGLTSATAMPPIALAASHRRFAPAHAADDHYRRYLPPLGCFYERRGYAAKCTCRLSPPLCAGARC